MERLFSKINVVSSGRLLRRERKGRVRTQIKMRRKRRRKERNTMTKKKRMNMTARENNQIGINHRQLFK